MKNLLEAGERTLFIGFVDFLNKLSIEIRIRVDLRQPFESLPNPFQLGKLLLTGRAALQVLGDLILIFGLQFPILKRGKLSFVCPGISFDYPSDICLLYS